MALGLTSALDKLKIKGSSQPEETNPTSPEKQDEFDELDTESKSILMGIISQLRPGCDLTKITLPTFVLEKKLMLERITNFFQIPELLLDANAKDDAQERFIGILRWYLASWHIAPKAVKKPLNPILGEVFTCYWDDIPGLTSAFYCAEQVSHHPPKSAYFYAVPELKIRVDGAVIPKSKFLGNSSAALMEGSGHVTLGNRDDEVYIMNQPNYYCRGILFGKLKAELGDHMYLKCPKTGLEADIDFKTKGFISGTYNAIEGFIYDTKTSAELFKITGKWDETIWIKDLETGDTKLLFDTTTARVCPPKVRPIDEQTENESRRLWQPTILALSKRDHESATEEKSKVENEQRAIAKRRAERGEKFHPRYFRRTNEADREFEGLEYVLGIDLNFNQEPLVISEELVTGIPILPRCSQN